MKLATALSERSDIQKRLSQLQVRLNNNAKVQQGDSPAENPEDLLKELDSLTKREEELIARINLTNSLTKVDDLTLTELLAKRDVLKTKLSILREFLDNASAKANRYSRTEIVMESTVVVAQQQKKLDKLSKQFRELDEKIQQLNWATDLI